MIYFPYNTAKCIHPEHLTMTDDRVRVVLDNDSALVGTNATFECLSGLAFSGPSYISTCMENGEWEPDPSQIECIGK